MECMGSGVEEILEPVIENHRATPDPSFFEKADSQRRVCHTRRISVSKEGGVVGLSALKNKG